MKEARPVLALDFDGVLCDSTEECIVTAWNGWLSYQGKHGFFWDPREVPEPYQSCIRRFRGYVRTGGEYLVLIRAAEKGWPIHSQREYEEAVSSVGSETRNYEKAFFTARDKMRLEDESRWFDLHLVYNGVPEKLQRLWSEFDVIVVTGKDSEAVQTFLRSFRLSPDPGRIYDKDAAHDKLEAIRRAASETGRPLEQITLLDDNIVHLLPVQKAGSRVFMAGWGYHTDEHLETAKANKVPVVSLENWDGEIRRACGGKACGV